MTDLDVHVTRAKFSALPARPISFNALLSRCEKARMRWALVCRLYATISGNPIDGAEISVG
jgi:hypothetical protein